MLNSLVFYFNEFFFSGWFQYYKTSNLKMGSSTSAEVVIAYTRTVFQENMYNLY